MAINLFVSHYKDQDPERNAELQECIRLNSENPEINYIPIYTDGYRITFNEFFERINSQTKQDDVNIIANLDIYLDYSTTNLFNEVSDGEVFALSRWQLNKIGIPILHKNPNSQDSWTFRGHVRNVNADFHIGCPGCDNRLAKIFYDAGWKVTNPCKSIKTIHLHKSRARRYESGYRGHYDGFPMVTGEYKDVPPVKLQNESKVT